MVILWKSKQRKPGTGYATTFLNQVEEVLGTCLDRGIRIVSNAGGLNPSGLADEIAALADRLGLAPRIAHVAGDDILDRIDALTAAGVDLNHLDTGAPLAQSTREVISANVYLGGWGITEALAAGADIVVCPRVTDASLVVGPAAWWHGWQRDDWDALAGAVAAGHVIECGPQATGGNYPLHEETDDVRYPGFPIAEVAADGSSVITKHEGTGGVVSIGTITAQLLYEIAAPAYPNPDVTAHFDTIRLIREGPDRIRISDIAGSPPPGMLKVAINQLGGYRNTMTMVLTGLDIETKAARTERMLFDLLGGADAFEEIDVRLLRFDHPDAPVNEQATAHLQITVKDQDAAKVGRHFSGATMQLALASYAGFHTTTPPTAETAYGVYWPALVPRDVVEHAVVLPDGSRRPVPHSPTGPPRQIPAAADPAVVADGTVVRAPLGAVCLARSGDKGGNANVGVWTTDERRYAWLRSYLTTARFRELLTESAELEIQRYELPNLLGLNFVVVGLLGDGVASATRPDPQAKGLGEYVRSRFVEVPEALL